MVWTPKSTAPAYFSLADAFISLVTGDPVWGWLVDWATLIPSTGTNTAEFCAAGPPGSVDLTPIFSFRGLDRNPIEVAAKIAAITAALTVNAQDRVFGAYCQEVVATAPLIFGPDTCADYLSAPPSVDTPYLAATVPAGATHLRWSSGPFPGPVDTHMITIGPPGPAFRDDWYPGDNPGGAHGPEVRGCYAGNQVYVRVNYRAGGTAGPWNFCLAFDNQGVIDHTPTPQPQPPGAISPITPVSPDLPGIAHETERLEFKMDTMLAIIQAIAGATLDLGGALAAPVALPVDTPVDVGDAVGCVITTTGVPASRSLDFGSPQMIVRLGILNFGTDTAWYPSIWVTHTPFIVRPLPPGTTRVTITDLPPGASSSVEMIQRNK